MRRQQTESKLTNDQTKYDSFTPTVLAVIIMEYEAQILATGYHLFTNNNNTDGITTQTP